MAKALAQFEAARSGRRILLVVAAPGEARAVLAGLGCDPALGERPWVLHTAADRFDVIVTGVGKVNAGGAVAKFLDPARHSATISVGIAGALPCAASPPLGSIVVASTSVYADEGLETPDGFLDCASIGFPIGPFDGNSIPAHPELLSCLRGLADLVGPIATISTCSGTDALASQVSTRTLALAEAMEGAAVAHIAARLGVPAAELRIISNTTGARPRQRWDLKGALARLETVIGRL